jgi:hypothetical protein
MSIFFDKGTKPTKTGFLVKEGGFFKSKKKRWFALCGSFLAYFSDPLMGVNINFDEALGVISLYGAHVTKNLEGKDAFGVRPVGNDRMYVFLYVLYVAVVT